MNWFGISKLPSYAMRRTHIGILLSVVGIFLAACDQAPQQKVLRMSVMQLPPSLGNPYGTTNLPGILTWSAMFDALTFVDRDGELQPWLALSWQAIDKTAWRFELRDGVGFSNGERFDAAAVTATINYLISEAGKSESVSQEIANVTGAVVIDPLTVDILTKVPDPILPRSMATVRIVAPAAWRDLGPADFAQSPVGTGPFALEKWDTAAASFTAFRESWRPPKVDKLIIQQLPETPARLAALKSGQIDIAFALEFDNVEELESLGFKMSISHGPNILSVSFITVKESPLQDVRVRRALNYAVNRQEIVDVILRGLTEPATQGAPRVAYNYNPNLKPYPYDPERARTLLAEAGYADGFEFVFEAVVDGYAGQIFQQVASDLAEVGVTMKIRQIPVPQLIRGIRQGDWAGTAFGMDYNTAPSLDALRPLTLHSCQWIKPWHCDESLMPLLEEAQQTFSPDVRRERTYEVLKQHRDNAPAIFLYDSVGITGLAPNVTGYKSVNYFIDYASIDLEAP